MNRRDFIRSLVGGSLGLLLPVELSSTLTIVDIKFGDIGELIKVGSGKVVNGEYLMDVTVDTDNIMSKVALIDNEGREWITKDNGSTWQSGLMSFELGDVVVTDESIERGNIWEVGS